MKVEPVILESTSIRLEPLEMNHCNALCDIGFDEDLWRVGLQRVMTREAMVQYIQTALDQYAKGITLPFVIKVKKTDTIVGSTRFMNIDGANRKVEIGATWVAQPWQRSSVNTETKFLMLKHAFEQWKCLRVEFKTDVLNSKSREAIKRIGAVEEGVLRKHAITSTGRVRDTVYYSILDEEWNNIQKHFTSNLIRT